MTSRSVVLTGSRTPRVRSVPSYVSTSGPEAVELAASAGLHLLPWQSDFMDDALGERAGGLWSAFEVAGIVSRQNGKGALLEARALAGLFLFGEKLILHSAHEYKTAAEAFLRIKSLIENTDDLRKKCRKPRVANGEQGIELLNGNRLRFVARSQGSGRGFSGDCVILDEAYALTAAQMAALLPTLSTRPNPQVWYTSSAGGPSTHSLNAVRDRGLTGEDPSLCFLEWSAKDGADLDDRQAWAEGNPSLGLLIPEEFVERERRAMPDREFAIERLSIWGSAESESVIPLPTWLALEGAGAIADDAAVSFGVDVAPDRSSASIGVAAVRKDGRQQVELVEIGDGTGWVVEALLARTRRWGRPPLVIDPGGPAGSLLGPLIAAGIEPTLVSGRQVGQACGAFYDAVLEDKLRHPGEPALTAAVLNARRRPLGDAWAWARKDSTDITPLYAVTLAKFGLDTRRSVDLANNIW